MADRRSSGEYLSFASSESPFHFSESLDITWVSWSSGSTDFSNIDRCGIALLDSESFALLISLCICSLRKLVQRFDFYKNRQCIWWQQHQTFPSRPVGLCLGRLVNLNAHQARMDRGFVTAERRDKIVTNISDEFVESTLHNFWDLLVIDPFKTRSPASILAKRPLLSRSMVGNLEKWKFFFFLVSGAHSAQLWSAKVMAKANTAFSEARRRYLRLCHLHAWRLLKYVWMIACPIVKSLIYWLW